MKRVRVKNARLAAVAAVIAAAAAVVESVAAVAVVAVIAIAVKPARPNFITTVRKNGGFFFGPTGNPPALPEDPKSLTIPGMAAGANEPRAASSSPLRRGEEGRGEEELIAKTHDMNWEMSTPLSGSMASQARHESVSPQETNAS